MYEFQGESTLYSLPECQGTSCLKQGPYLKFKLQPAVIIFIDDQFSPRNIRTDIFCKREHLVFSNLKIPLIYLFDFKAFKT